METINPRNIYSPIQDVFAHFPDELKEANEFLEQPIVVSSAIDEHRDEQHLLRLLKWIKVEDLLIHTTGYSDILLK